ncbi:MAG: dUTP diphosphatase [Synergistaceae bacterium]|nr:dUTP diphosphatase [Synergistaceae bacterium]
MSVTVRIRCENGATLPSYATDGASGMDIRAIEEATIAPLARALISTGLYFELPEGTEAQVRPRSGLAIKNGITVLNSPGTIDADYRGEIKIILINLNSEPFTVHVGDRIAQVVFATVTKANLVEVKKINETERGVGGFGSTGVQ